jgi:CheY-like chemotaxis protein
MTPGDEEPGRRATATAGTGDRLSVLVGIPDARERARVSALLRGQGHVVLEAANAREMQLRLDELDRGEGTGPDAIVCAGLLAEEDDPRLAARLAAPARTRALILLPSDGLLATAARAHRLRASAVLPDVPALRRLRELLAQPG